jgi:hypothetical protein
LSVLLSLPCLIQGLPGLAARGMKSVATHRMLTGLGRCLEKVRNLSHTLIVRYYWVTSVDPVLRSRVGRLYASIIKYFLVLWLGSNLKPIFV